MDYVRFCENCSNQKTEFEAELERLRKERDEDLKFYMRDFNLNCIMWLIGGVLLGTLLGAAIVSRS